MVGKSGREIWISVFAMMISCPELVKIKRGNKIKVVRSGVVGTAGVRDGGAQRGGYEGGCGVGNCAYAVHLIKLKGSLFVFIGIYQ